MSNVSATSSTFETADTISIPYTLSANSMISTNNGQPIYIEYIWEPGRVRWELKNPSGEIVYFIETSIEHSGDSHWINDESVYVPAFPQQGAWKLELWTYDPITKLVATNLITWTFNVGESNILDNLFAPVCITWEGVAYLGWGAFSIALPGIFWLTIPIWGFFAFAFIVRFWRGSFKLAIRDFRKGIEEINKRRTRKRVKND